MVPLCSPHNMYLDISKGWSVGLLIKHIKRIFLPLAFLEEFPVTQFYEDRSRKGKTRVVCNSPLTSLDGFHKSVLVAITQQHKAFSWLFFCFVFFWVHSAT